jgi:hypothetical protein
MGDKECIQNCDDETSYKKFVWKTDKGVEG